MRRFFALPLFVIILVTGAIPVFAGHDADLHSRNIRLVGSLADDPTVIHSDLAFWGDRAYAGDFDGFRIIDISDPTNPTLITDFSCPASQNDISVWDRDGDGHADLLFLSIDGPRTGTACGDPPTVASNPAGSFEGIRIIDISNELSPAQLATVPTDCGSHTHTLVPDEANGRVLVYVSSYPLGAAALTEGLPDNTKPDGTQCVEPHSKISIVSVPLSGPITFPGTVSVVERALDGGTIETERTIGPRTFRFKGCHDISVFMELNLAAGACWAEAQLWDISSPDNPVFLRRDRNPFISDLFHSAAFSWDGKMVAFGDEAGGGGAARCTDPNDTQGRLWFYDLSLNLLGSFKIPRPQPDVPGPSFCTAHNFNFVPIRNRHIIAGSWYDGGTSVVDLTNIRNPREIAFYDRQAPNPADTWSSYWYNGFIYANDGLDSDAIGRFPRENTFFDVFQVTGSGLNRAQNFTHMNPQTQESLLR